MSKSRYSSLYLIIAVCFIPLFLGAQELSKTYSSGMTNAIVTAITNSSREESLYYLDVSNSIATVDTAPYMGLPNWRSGLIVNPSHAYIGYRSTVPKIRVNPIYLPDSTAPQTHTRFTLLEEDPHGDSAVPLNHLDILETKVSFSETKLFYSIKNYANDFPVSSGLFTFFSYMGVIINPNADPDSNPTVFGLMHTVNVAGIIAPGLYRITGTSTSDLNLIGSIESSIDAANSTLTLSCNLSDLLADPEFSSWYNPEYPLVATQAITSKITLTGGNQLADTTVGGDILLRPQLLSGNQSPPSLTNPVFNWSDGNLSAQFTYTDADHNAPTIAFVSIDQGPTSVLVPLNFNGFDDPVVLEALPFTCPQNWSSATVTLVFGAAQVDFTFENPVANDDLVSPVPSLSIYPNPVRDQLFISYDQEQKLRTEDVDVFNLKGQRQICELDAEGNLRLDGLASGVYFIKVKTDRGMQTRSFVKRN